MNDITKIVSSNFYDKVAELLKEARKTVVQNINQTMVLTYFEIGRMIIEEEQGGQERAGYGKQQTLSVNSEKPIFCLSWSHYLKLMRINDENEIRFYYG